jgi:hypothetical protein
MSQLLFFIPNLFTMMIGGFALLAGILTFVATKKYKIAAITFTHSKKE